jgi:hypothetical protein
MTSEQWLTEQFEDSRTHHVVVENLSDSYKRPFPR